MNKSEKRALELYPVKIKQNKIGEEYDANLPRRKVYLRGYDEALANHKQLWKDAQGDELPEYDREVIVLLDNGKVVFAHRPNPEGWDGKSLTTGKVEHYTPQCYDKGGWNQPNVKFWLDYQLPVKEEGKDEKDKDCI